MRLLIVGEHLLVVELLIKVLEVEHTIAASFLRGGDAIAWLAHYMCDCAIVDLALPDFNGAELIMTIRRLRRATRIVAISSGAGAIGGDNVGADAFVPKVGSLALLRHEIGRSHQGHAGFDVAGRQLLTPNKVAILRAVASGYRAREIAAMLRVSQNTAEEYLEQLKRQLGARTLAQLVTAALRLGLAADLLSALPPATGSPE